MSVKVYQPTKNEQKKLSLIFYCVGNHKLIRKRAQQITITVLGIGAFLMYYLNK